MRWTHNLSPLTVVDDPFRDGAIVWMPLFVPLSKARSCETASAARLLQEIARRAVSRAPSTFGGSAASLRKHVLALIVTQQRDSLSSLAIESIDRSSAEALREEPASGRFSDRADEFGDRLIPHSSFVQRCVQSD